MSIRSRSRQQPSTRDGVAWYAGTRAGSEARAAFEQAEKLSRVPDNLGERMKK
jgi:hypothetical protein